MINIRLDEEGAFVEIKKGKVSQWKKVTIQSIVIALNESIGKRVNTEPEPSPVLPPGTIGYIKYPDNNSCYEVLMYQPKCRSTVLYEDRVFNNIGTPATIYQFKVMNNCLLSTNMWAVMEKVIRPEMTLYCFPFYNVNGSSGRLCIGENHIKINEPWELFKVPAAIQAMPSTMAYPFRNTMGLGGDSLFKKLKNKDFPDEWLVPAKITLSQLMKAGK